MISSFGLRSDEDLLLWLLERNAELAAVDDAGWLERLQPVGRSRKAAKEGKGKALAAAVKKSRASGFFLGLDLTWLNAGFES